MVVVAGEITSKAKVNYADVVREVIRDVAIRIPPWVLTATPARS